MNVGLQSDDVLVNGSYITLLYLTLLLYFIPTSLYINLLYVPSLYFTSLHFTLSCCTSLDFTFSLLVSLLHFISLYLTLRLIWIYFTFLHTLLYWQSYGLKRLSVQSMQKYPLYFSSRICCKDTFYRYRFLFSISEERKSRFQWQGGTDTRHICE